jgi:malate permease and related proteins
MQIFILVFIKLLALFCLIGMGFLARRVLDIDRTSIAKLLFYVLAPLVFFSAIGKLKPDISLFILPLITALISSSVAYFVLTTSKSHFDGSTGAILAFSSANSNVGYFLLPIVWEIFNEKAAGIFVIMVLGNTLYENTIGFFIASRGHFTVKESIYKVIKLPVIYAIALGFIISVSKELYIPQMFDDMLLNVRGAYATLGMMMIGFGLADIKDYKLDLKFIGASFIVKFLIWPIFALALVMIDKYLTHMYDPVVHNMLILFSTAPLAANNIIISTVLDSHPERVASAVLASTIFALFYIPLIIVVFGLN